MQVIKTSINIRSNLLRERIAKVRSGFAKLMQSLSVNVKPCSFVGFGSPMPIKNNTVLLGWSYDWSDKGDDPPPWSDWGDKTE
jgi:hypothetical protein